ncbi:MAG: hypothetical protein JXA94_01030 [Parachlamydiales bacterium]|nr:hypothetical protein [Parachlamydiales bacterium]
MFKRISMIEGSSVYRETLDQVKQYVKKKRKVLVALDSNHTHDHVLKELELYSPFVSKGSYLVVFDTIIEDLPNDTFLDRPWDKKNNPKTAIREFLKTNDSFMIDEKTEKKILISACLEGYLKRIK